MPIYGLFTLLYWINWEVISVVELIGIANPIPSIPVPESFKVFIPITFPSLLTNAPPLLPEFIDASVWINVNFLPSESVTSLFTALIIPHVTLLCIPSGLPTAIANSPTLIESESANSAFDKPDFSILITAKSVCSSFPTILASYSVSSLNNVTVTFVASDTS